MHLVANFERPRNPFPQSHPLLNGALPNAFAVFALQMRSIFRPLKNELELYEKKDTKYQLSVGVNLQRYDS